MRYTNALLIVPLILSAAIARGSEAEASADLTVERLFNGPDLSGPRLRTPEFSPDGRYVTYLQGKPENKDQLDLWAFDMRTGKHRLLVDSEAFVKDAEPLSAEEEARRERQRTASLRGIVEYKFSSDGKRLLVPIGGDLYIYDLTARTDPVRRLTATEAYETDAKFSPRGNFVSFVRDQDVSVIELATGQERALTTDGEGLIQNGVAEFVAQEEMGRSTGYWWSPDEAHIAFARIDDSPVQEVERFEINADGARVIRQRYPAAGTANTSVALKVVAVASGEIAAIDIDFADHYLARVNWLRDSEHLAVQRQTRDQKRLELLKVDVRGGKPQLLLEETSPTWIELHDDLRFLEKRNAFVWASRRSGYRHLYLHDLEGKLIRQLTDGPWMAVGDGTENAIVGIDEQRGLVYFMANEASPLERHLYATSLTTSQPQKVRRISREAGWHDAKLMPGGQRYLDQWSAPDRPPNSSIRSVDGKLERWLIRNELDASHPYKPYADQHAVEEFGSIKAVDGQDLYYRLLKPVSLQPGKRHPVVIDVYGGPHFQYVRKDWMGGARAVQGYFRQILARNGFVVLTLDNRGSGFRGERFDTIISGRLGKIEIEDQIRGVEFLKSLPYVDPQRIGIMGWSYGGYMALMALATTDAFRAGVAGAPVTDWRLYDTHYTERYLGMPGATGSYEASAVLPYAKSLNGSLLLVHGMADDNVLFTHSTMLMQQLQSLDKPFDLMTYPGSKHGLIRMPQTGQHYYEMVLRFFGRELKQ